MHRKGVENAGAVPVFLAAARPRAWFGCDRRIVLLGSPLCFGLIAFAPSLLWVFAGIALLLAIYGVGRILWAINPFLLDDFFGAWEFEERYSFDSYGD